MGSKKLYNFTCQFCRSVVGEWADNMGKRKGDTMRDKISEMAKKVKSDNSSSSEEEKATHDYKKEVEEFNGGADKNDILEDETKEDYLKRILEHSKNADIYFERKVWSAQEERSRKESEAFHSAYIRGRGRALARPGH
jgi:soluble cytochrome b562